MSRALAPCEVCKPDAVPPTHTPEISAAGASTSSTAKRFLAVRREPRLLGWSSTMRRCPSINRLGLQGTLSWRGRLHGQYACLDLLAHILGDNRRRRRPLRSGRPFRRSGIEGAVIDRRREVPVAAPLWPSSSGSSTKPGSGHLRARWHRSEHYIGELKTARCIPVERRNATWRLVA